MADRKTRREFLQQTALAGAGLWLAGRPLLAQSKSPNEKLNIAVIGVSGQGGWNLNNITSQNIVALCDVDVRRTGPARELCKNAKFYTDYRKLLDQKDVEAVLVATPDHVHAFATMAALKSGRHVYCEKPLTHSLWEADLVAKTARKAGLATQMGTQMHSTSHYRRIVELIQTKAIGEVTEVHVWVERSWAGGDRPTDTPPVPEGLHYDLWLGPAPYRPYHPDYMPANWRGWWDFGGGTLGDMGCHYIDLVKWSLKLGHPTTVEAEGPQVHAEAAPKWLIARYEFPKRGSLPPVKMTWYHGGKRPALFEQGKLPKWDQDGILFVGSEGMLIMNYDKHALLPEDKYADFKPPAPFIPDSIGHHAEWIEACKHGGKTLCNFDYAAPLTQTVLLGNVAYRAGQKIEWDPKKVKATNAPEAAKYIRRSYREGWTI